MKQAFLISCIFYISDPCLHTHPSFIPELGTLDETNPRVPRTLSVEAFLSNVNETTPLLPRTLPNETFPNSVIIPMSPCIINIPLTPEQLERQQRINHALQIGPCRKVLITFCIGLTSTWLLGASVMAILHVANSN